LEIGIAGTDLFAGFGSAFLFGFHNLTAKAPIA
jgi:hypothetical protein